MGKKTILIVDDDKDTRDFYEFAVSSELTKSSLDYEVKTAKNAQDALKLSIDDLAVVCTDGELYANIKGWELAKALRARNYKGPIIYIGGTEVPKEHRDLFTDQIHKDHSAEIAERIIQYLQK